MIRFVDDGVTFNEIDENRNYFLTEVETIIERIRVRLKNEKRVSAPKEYECYVDGMKVVVTDVRFEESYTLEEKILSAIEDGGWEDDIKHKYINKINEYYQTEREYMSHREFRAFAIRFDQYMGDPNIKPFPLVLTIEQLKMLFDDVHVNISTGFYSELEGIMASIHEATLTIAHLVEKELLEVDVGEHEGSFEDFLQNKMFAWLGEEENFNKFKNYIVARYSSVPKSRINALYPKYLAYQSLQEKIFIEYAEKVGFNTAYELNKDILESFDNKYTGALFEGFAMRDDEMLESVIISPIVRDLLNKVDGLLSELEKNEGDVEEFDKGMTEDE